MAEKLLREWTKDLLAPVARLISRTGVSPNVLTVLGFLATVGVSIVLASGQQRVAGLLMVPVGLVDALDGALARLRNRATRFGAFLDSTLDRFAEIALYLGLLYLYRETTPETLLIYLTITGSLMVSYTRARAEGLGIECKVGLFGRFERLATLVLGLVLGQIRIALIILAVFSNLTALQRMWHVRKATSSASAEDKR